MIKRKRLSSNLTFPYKYIVPLIPIGLAIFINLTINKETNQGYLIPLNLLLLIFFLIAYLPLKDLKKVEYDENYLITSNFISIDKFRLKDVIQVNRWMFYFYKVTVKKENEITIIKFLAPAHERIFRPFRKLNSIIEFEKKIQKKQFVNSITN